MSRITWARYVPHDRILDYLRCGWMLGEPVHDQQRHHAYTFILVWPCACKVVEP